MSKARKCKIAILFAAFFAAAVMAIVALPKTVKADIPASSAASTYFDYNEKVTNAVFANDAVEFTVAPTEELSAEISFKNQLSARDLGFVFDKVDELKEIEITLTAKSSIATGNYNGTEYKTEIDNVLKITFTDPSNISYDYNGITGTSPFGNLEYRVSNGYIIPNLLASETGIDEFYKVNTESVVPVSVKIEIISLQDEKTSTTFAITDVNQKATGGYDGTNVFNQKFVKDGENIKSAMPIADISTAAFYNFDNNGVNQVRRYYQFSDLTMQAYSVFGDSAANYYLKSEDSTVVINGTNKRNITFMDVGERVFSIYNKVDEEEIKITEVKVNVNGDGENAPEYIEKAQNEKALDSFSDALNKALYKDAERTKFVDVGSGKTLTLPTFKSLVKDDITSYANLEYTVYYWSPETASTTSSMYLPINVPGDYIFFVAFKDAAGNEMKKDDFCTTDDKDPTKLEFDGKYKDFVFRFSILDNSELSVKGASQSDGYVGVKYQASAFDITASNYTETYRLFYSADKKDLTAEGWKEILSVDKIADVDAESVNGDYTYDQLKAIAYDGKLSFTPDKTGYYKIECVVTSTSTNRSASSATSVAINEKPQTVTPDDHWLQNNVASVVFLSIGSACLVAIIVLLFIKPKDAETNEKPKKKK